MQRGDCQGLVVVPIVVVAAAAAVAAPAAVAAAAVPILEGLQRKAALLQVGGDRQQGDIKVSFYSNCLLL